MTVVHASNPTSDCACPPSADGDRIPRLRYSKPAARAHWCLARAPRPESRSSTHRPGRRAQWGNSGFFHFDVAASDATTGVTMPLARVSPMACTMWRAKDHRRRHGPVPVAEDRKALGCARPPDPRRTVLAMPSVRVHRGLAGGLRLAGARPPIGPAFPAGSVRSPWFRAATRSRRRRSRADAALRRCAREQSGERVTSVGAVRHLDSGCPPRGTSRASGGRPRRRSGSRGTTALGDLLHRQDRAAGDVTDSGCPSPRTWSSLIVHRSMRSKIAFRCRNRLGGVAVGVGDPALLADHPAHRGPDCGLGDEVDVGIGVALPALCT